VRRYTEGCCTINPKIPIVAEWRETTLAYTGYQTDDRGCCLVTLRLEIANSVKKQESHTRSDGKRHRAAAPICHTICSATSSADNKTEIAGVIAP